MKTVDVSRFTVVKAGLPCESQTPIRLEHLVSVMERNEAYIYWLQPAGGTFADQFPCVSINAKFYMLNLKLEKAIFRHVRLCRDFKNYEMLEDGTKKLRIPQRLLNEKLKTSCRFQVRPRARARPSRIVPLRDYLMALFLCRAWPTDPLPGAAPSARPRAASSATATTTRRSARTCTACTRRCARRSRRRRRASRC